MSHRVVITGIGMISPLGLDTAATWKALLAGTGVPLLINDRLDIALLCGADGLHVGPMLLGSWLVVSLIKGQPIMAGWVPQRLLVGWLLNGIAFGIGLGLLYPLLTKATGQKT